MWECLIAVPIVAKQIRILMFAFPKAPKRPQEDPYLHAQVFRLSECACVTEESNVDVVRQKPDECEAFVRRRRDSLTRSRGPCRELEIEKSELHMWRTSKSISLSFFTCRPSSNNKKNKSKCSFGGKNFSMSGWMPMSPSRKRHCVSAEGRVLNHNTWINVDVSSHSHRTMRDLPRVLNLGGKSHGHLVI